MAVVGIDLGNLASKIGVARRRGIDVIANEVSNLATPSLVSFTPRQRLIGESAKTAETSNFKNTIGSLKRLIGRTLNDPEIQEIEKKYINAELVDVNGTVGIRVKYLGETSEFSATQLVAMYLAKLRDTAAAELNQNVSDVVIAIPGWFTDVQRRALLDAAQIAGLNALRLINDHTAVALGYGITKSDLPETPENARNVIFVDIGHSDYSVAVVAFSKGQLVTKASAYDRHFGGRNFDYALVEHFAHEFKTKYKIDVMNNPKAIFRLTTGCERLKKVLSANAEAPLNVESIMNDVDAASSLKREQFEEMMSSLLDRITVPLDAALKDSGLTIDQIDSVELVGGCTRMPSVKERIQKWYGGKTLSFTLNQDEAICRGATFACASLSPVFRVREFNIYDMTAYPVRVTWSQEAGNPDEDTELVVFPKGNAIPSTKILTFHRAGPFDLEASYTEDANIPKGINSWIGKVAIKGVQKPASGDFATVKVKARMNLHGILNFEEAYTVEEVEEDETYTVGEGEEKKEETRKVKKIRRKDSLKLVTGFTGLTEETRNTYQEKEGTMFADDKLVMETEDRKNALEEYVYDIRSKLDGRYAPFVQASEKEAILSATQAAEDWLYSEEGEDATKSAYVSKLDELKKLGDPVAFRWRESEDRARAASALREVIDNFMSLAQSEDEKYSHIEQADRTKVIELCATNKQWLDDNLYRQMEKAKNVNPVITTAEIYKRRDDVQFTSAAIMNKPKPKPKTEVPPPTTEAPKQEKTDVEMEGEEQEPKITEMDVD
ncbi:hypothetical protein QFC22_002401 [Naganishia vaughanmartiniae]|uniref:Uncharacterized protein n=1 Tax=Naganishia vaughanmartiniae TaxID=1424756 RepID=A0ACC2XCJ7_9TREE|nr:hypothetical protein QFC22_002401 [Naganishia vaughanmartiniae]